MIQYLSQLWKRFSFPLSDLGLLNTWSQGRCSTQIKHSYWCKSWNQPQGLYARSQGWTRKNLFNLPQVTTKCWTLLTPSLEKGYHRIWEANLQPLRPMFQHLVYLETNVLAFISNLGPNNRPKMLKVGPKFFRPWLLVLNGP